MKEEEEKLPEAEVSLEIGIETDDEGEIIIVTFTPKGEDAGKDIVIGLSIQEAQLFGIMLGETVTAALLKKLQLSPHQSDSTH